MYCTSPAIDSAFPVATSPTSPTSRSFESHHCQCSTAPFSPWGTRSKSAAAAGVGCPCSPGRPHAPRVCIALMLVDLS
ncbi:hypothetical protein C8R44DRAFT_788375 [Mycena epipterygia]|nr:hypothetical protein C8R44DRAFT_788375 [Mycena epipterygia]